MCVRSAFRPRTVLLSAVLVCAPQEFNRFVAAPRRQGLPQQLGGIRREAFHRFDTFGAVDAWLGSPNWWRRFSGHWGNTGSPGCSFPEGFTAALPLLSSPTAENSFAAASHSAGEWRRKSADPREGAVGAEMESRSRRVVAHFEEHFAGYSRLCCACVVTTSPPIVFVNHGGQRSGETNWKWRS